MFLTNTEHTRQRYAGVYALNQKIRYLTDFNTNYLIQ